MATLYTDIYQLFLQKVQSYDLNNLQSTDLSNLLSGFLHSAIPKFQYKCVNDLTNRDDIQGQFNIDLGDDDKEILSYYMVMEYLLQKINTDELLRQGLTNKEWDMTSQANQLTALINDRNVLKKEVEDLVMEYTYNHSDLGELQ